jgi:hypothetical protein
MAQHVRRQDTQKLAKNKQRKTTVLMASVDSLSTKSPTRMETAAPAAVNTEYNTSARINASIRATAANAFRIEAQAYSSLTGARGAGPRR